MSDFDKVLTTIRDLLLHPAFTEITREQFMTAVGDAALASDGAL